MTNGKNNNSRVTKKTAVITVGFDIFLIIATIVLPHVFPLFPERKEFDYDPEINES